MLRSRTCAGFVKRNLAAHIQQQKPVSWPTICWHFTDVCAISPNGQISGLCLSKRIRINLAHEFLDIFAKKKDIWISCQLRKFFAFADR